MSPKEIASRVGEIAKPIIESLGYELFDVKYKLQAGRWVLTIVIDNPRDYVSTRDCEIVSYELEKQLDASDFIPGSYILEVSSPGLDRPLRNINDFERFVGKLAKVKAGKTYKGYIKSVNKETGNIVLDVDGKDIEINIDEVKSANLEIDF
ncbi:ribosome maturation factor RimP [Fervidobacterium thailandense]|uniref:ribosome maturation factor RimP n=1 Tax=Fervidobacterium thailandense TaxID=1008305 RepID=UPI00355BD1A2